MKKILLVRLDKIGDLIASLPADQIFNSPADTFQTRWVVFQGLEKLVQYSAPDRKFTTLANPKSVPVSTSISSDSTTAGPTATTLAAMPTPLSKWAELKQQYIVAKEFKKIILSDPEFIPDAIVFFYAPMWAYLTGFLMSFFSKKKIKCYGRYSQWYSFLFLHQGLRQSRSQSKKSELSYNIEIANLAKTELLKDFPMDSNLKNQIHSKTSETSQANDLPINYNSQSDELPINNSLKSGGVEPINGLQLDVHKIPDMQNKWNKIRQQFQLIEKNYIVVHPGMAGSALNWPIHKWSEWIATLVNDKQRVVITGTQMDKKWLDDLRDRWEHHPRVAWTESKLTFDDLLITLSKAHHVYAPSTGVLHLAIAVGCSNVTGIYSPILAHHPLRWGPIQNKMNHPQQVQTILPALQNNCPAKSKCLGNQCPEFNCMDKINLA